jgi:hypothetical protein
MRYGLPETTGNVLTKKYHKGHKTIKAKGRSGNENTKNKNAMRKLADGKERIY